MYVSFAINSSHLFLQMEYCENETLRQLIDAGQLHSDKELVWRLFRELVEGLEHIHSKVWCGV